MSAGSRRVIAAVLVACVTLFAFEGVVTTFTGSSLLRRLPLPWGAMDPAADLDWRSRTEDERMLAAASNPGILRLHPDPLVGYVLRSNSDLAIHEGRILSDVLGLRARPRPWPGDGDPLRIAIVGASMPFGYGLSDEDTIANRLEELLEASREPGARSVVCRTVAMGRWSTRNAVSFLLDHFDDLRPDIVVYLSFPNELSDTDIVSETGSREPFPDPASADPWLSVRADQNAKLLARLKLAYEQAGMVLQPEVYGPDVLTADISPESRRRYDESAEYLLHLAQKLRARGRALILMPCIQHEHAYHLLARLWASLPALPAAPLLTWLPAEMTLGYDPHPNAGTARVMATLIAQALFDHGLLERGAGVPLPEVPLEYAALLAPAFTAAQVESSSAMRHEQARALLQSAVDFTTGHGVEQIYGGVSVSGIVGPRALLLLSPAGPVLDVELAPVTERPALYPLDVTVQIDGAPVGVVTVTAEGPARVRLPLPARPDPDAPMEVKLIAPRWVVVRFGYTFELAAFRPVRVSCGAR